MNKEESRQKLIYILICAWTLSVMIIYSKLYIIPKFIEFLKK